MTPCRILSQLKFFAWDGLNIIHLLGAWRIKSIIFLIFGNQNFLFPVGMSNSFICSTYLLQTQNQNNHPIFLSCKTIILLFIPKRCKLTRENQKRIIRWFKLVNKCWISTGENIWPALIRWNPIIYHLCVYILCIKNENITTVKW